MAVRTYTTLGDPKVILEIGFWNGQGNRRDRSVTYMLVDHNGITPVFQPIRLKYAPMLLRAMLGPKLANEIDADVSFYLRPDVWD